MDEVPPAKNPPESPPGGFPLPYALLGLLLVADAPVAVLVLFAAAAEAEVVAAGGALHLPGGLGAGGVGHGALPRGGAGLAHAAQGLLAFGAELGHLPVPGGGRRSEVLKTGFH